MKKQFFMFLSLIMFLGSLLPSVSAQSSNELIGNLNEIQSLEFNKGYDINVVKDDKSQRVVEVFDEQEGKTYRSTFNKKDKSFLTVEVDKATNKEKVIVNSSSLSNQQSLNDIITPMSLQLIDSGANSSGKYKYYYYTDSIWAVISDGKSKNTKETSINSGDLNSFRTSVKNLLLSETKYKTMLGTAITSSFIALVASPTGWGTILATLTAIGATTAAINEVQNAYLIAGDCRYYFGRITVVN